MKWKDNEGKELEIAYSTEVQKNLEKTMRETLVWRKRMYKTLNSIKWLMIIFLVVGVAAVLYLDSKNVPTSIGKALFCA